MEKTAYNNERVDSFGLIERNMNKRQAEFKSGAELLLENNYDDYLKDIIKIAPH